MARETVEIERLTMMPYLGILTYPRPNLKAARSRIKQLGRLGVERVTFEGRTKIGRLGLVGIGTVGLVVKASGSDGGEFALKIRRTDANRSTMLEEFRLTKLANGVQVGAPAYRCSRDFISMGYVRGIELEDYLKGNNGKGSAWRLRGVCHAVLNQCRRLDLIGLDHGQLSNLRKHAIIAGETPYIIDFESASQNRAPKNVTTAAQYLFVGGRHSTRIRRTLSMKPPEEVLDALRRYKGEISDENYARLLATFGVVA